jgi:hypothetical protein
LPARDGSNERTQHRTRVRDRSCSPESATAPLARAESQAENVSLTRLAWFDANGDGDIDPRPAGAGGDATLLVPSHAVDLPVFARPATGVSYHGPRPESSNVKSGAAPNQAQTRQALDAYSRYGQSAPAAPTPAPAPVVVVAPTPAQGDSTGAALSGQPAAPAAA